MKTKPMTTAANEPKSNPLEQRYLDLIVEPSSENSTVWIVTLNRPRKRNALNANLWREIGKVFNDLSNEVDCRCVLLSGAGQSFCAGIDISDDSIILINDEADVARRVMSFQSKIMEMQAAFTSLEICRAPVVVAMHGHCIGAGLDLACCADIRLCCQDTIFSVKEVQLGLAADVGVLQRLPKLVGGASSRVRELCFTGQNFVSHEACKMGLVSGIATTHSQLMDMAMKICVKIAQNSPVAVSGTKLSLNYSRDHSIDQGLSHIATHNSFALITDDLMISAMKMRDASLSFAPLLPPSKL